MSAEQLFTYVSRYSEDTAGQRAAHRLIERGGELRVGGGVVGSGYKGVGGWKEEDKRDLFRYVQRDEVDRHRLR